jgi:hypothetical protein
MVESEWLMPAMPVSDDMEGAIAEVSAADVLARF